MKPHKHAELIKAWADGAEIQHQGGDGNWYDSPSYPPQMIWYEGTNYRTKPEPKPDVVQYATARFNTISYRENQPNLQLTFNGETGKPKSAEVLK